jgi:hypothetical protein
MEDKMNFFIYLKVAFRPKIWQTLKKLCFYCDVQFSCELFFVWWILNYIAATII